MGGKRIWIFSQFGDVHKIPLKNFAFMLLLPDFLSARAYN